MNKKLLVSYAVIIAILIILWLSFPEKPKLLGVCSSVLGLIGLYLNYRAGKRIKQIPTSKSKFKINKNYVVSSK